MRNGGSLSSSRRCTKLLLGDRRWLLLRRSAKLLLRKLLGHELSLSSKLRIPESLRRLTLKLRMTKGLLLLVTISSLLLSLLLLWPSSKLAHSWVLGITLTSPLGWHEALWMLWKSLGI